MTTADPHTKFREDRSSGFRDMLENRRHTDRQTHTQTDRSITILCTPTGAE